MNDKIKTDTLHEIQNRVTYISSSLQLIAKQHPEVLDFDFWPAAMEELLELSLFVHASMKSPDQKGKT